MKTPFTICIFSFLAITITWAEEPVDLDMVNKIRDEGFNRSEVMESLRVLADEIGPRLTASPGMRAASKWSVEQLQAWGVKNVYLESFDFGRGWSTTRSEIHMTSPRQTQLYGLPVEWHPGTDGVVEGEIVYAPISSEEDFAEWEGKLLDKMVLIDEVGPPHEADTRNVTSYDDEMLDERVSFNVPVGERPPRDVWAKDMQYRHALSAFLAKEGAQVLVRKSSSDAMVIQMVGYQYHIGMTPEIPAVVLAAEHYKRLSRLADNDHVVRLSVDVDAAFHDDDPLGYSTIAEIAGQGRNPEIVMAGAHIDSHAPGDGAADNASGVAVVMEAMRILTALDVQPKRTIRIGLWSGEELEFYGSGEHVRRNFGSYPKKTDDMYKYVGDYEAADLSKPFAKERDYDKFSVYLNLDNGAGKIRGIYTEGNAAARPIFESWLVPFHDLDATYVTLNRTRSTDHESFQLIGLPGYQFIQDRNSGAGRGHNQIDLYDEIYEKDLKQASVIMASFLYHAAMRDERMPRKPEPVPILE
ncbi:MAG: M28 family peptidase [Woeseia sp.]|nr:M28 family peptidase [Woeseia sp.]MBT6211833.1 M28 family peptidase [Woeseia sp.]